MLGYADNCKGSYILMWQLFIVVFVLDICECVQLFKQDSLKYCCTYALRVFDDEV